MDSHNVDHRSDIYSAGCSLYFMLTGKPPFHEGTIAQRLARHQSREPEDIRSYRQDCPESLVDVVHKMMRKKPEDRFQHCDQLTAALRTIGDRLLISSPGIKKSSTGGAAAAASSAAAAAPSIDVQPKPGTRSKATSAKQATTKPASAVDAKTKAAKPKQAKPKQAKPSRDVAAAKRPEKSAAKKTAKPAAKPTEKPAAKRSAKPAAKPAAKVDSKGASPVARTESPSKASRGQQTAQPKSKSASAKPASKKTESAIPEAKMGSAPVGPSDRQPSDRQKSSRSIAKFDAGQKPSVSAADVSVVVSEAEQSAVQKVDDGEFRSFVTQNRSTKRQSVKPKRNSSKDQLVIAGLVIGMILVLGIVMIVANSFL